jgi:Leucine-rich repeat (LRR) protein
LGKLKYLNLDRNKIKSLPADIAQLKELKWLRLNYNALESLPPQIAKLDKIERLYLRYNKLSEVPPEMSELADTLQFLFLEGNNIPPEKHDAIRAMFPGVDVRF